MAMIGNIYPSDGQNGNIYSVDGISPSILSGQGCNGRGIGCCNAPKIVLYEEETDKRECGRDAANADR